MAAQDCQMSPATNEKKLRLLCITSVILSISEPECNKQKLDSYHLQTPLLLC